MAAKKKAWSRKSRFSIAEKAAILVEADRMGAPLVRAKYKLTKNTLGNWRQRVSPAEMRAALQALPTAQNGNGTHEEPAPQSSSGLREVEQALEAALAALRRHRLEASRVLLGEG